MTRVVFVGEMYNADLSIGGGPIYPGAPQPPLGIWGPTDPRPTHPIAGYPWPQPPQPPLGIWGPNDPRPTPPIAMPGPPLGIWGPTDPRPGWGLPTPQPPGGSPPYVDAGLPPFATQLPVIPPQSPIVDPIDPSKAYIVAYMPAAAGGYERITFTVDIPPPSVPTEPAPKV